MFLPNLGDIISILLESLCLFALGVVSFGGLVELFVD